MRFYFFLILIVSCNNTIPNKKNIIVSNTDFKNKTILYKSNKPYVLKHKIIIPENHTLEIKNGVDLFFKKKAKIINNGSLIVGERNIVDSVFSFKLKNETLFFGVRFYSKNTIDIISSSKQKNSTVFNNALFENINFYKKFETSYFNNSFFYKCVFNLDSTIIDFNNSFFYKNIISIYNSYNTNINNCVFSNMKNSIVLENIKNSVVNNCLFNENTKSLKYINSFNNSIINSVFNKNEIGLFLKNNKGYFKVFNNLFIKNKIALNNLDTSYIYLINNVFDLNNIILKSFIIKPNKKTIISKNNIFYNNKNIYTLKNTNISSSYCISNTDSLIGYYNILNDPLFINTKNFNYNLKSNSPGYRHGVNNNNLGINIDDINIIKYLKY